VHQALQHHHLMPATHLVDTGYLDAELLASSQQEYAVDVLRPIRPVSTGRPKRGRASMRTAS
jgi:transposase